MKTINFILFILLYIAFTTMVALIGFFWGLGWMILILSIRHILIGTPPVQKFFRGIFDPIFHLDTTSLPLQPWPNRFWIISSILYLVFSLVALIWFNVPLRILLNG